MGRIDKNGMPKPTYIKDKEKLIKAIDKAYRQMFDHLILQLQFNPDEPKVIREREIMRQMNYWIKEMDKQTAKSLEKLIKKTFKEGQAYHLLSVKEAKSWKDALNSTSFNAIQRAKVQALFEDTYEDILLATQNTQDSVKAIVRDQVRKVAQYHSMKNTNYKDQQKDLLKELSKEGLSERVSKEGFVGIEDARGRKWDLKTYSNMVIKTKVNDAFTQGIMHESEETGFDLAVISHHGAKDACRKWEGMVISLHGKTKGYITYKQARATNEIWHPNCEHTLHPIRNLDQLHPDDIAIHKKQMSEIGDVSKRVYKRKK